MYVQTNKLAASGDNTTCSTLWTLTMMELLMDNLSDDRPDKEIIAAFKELYDKGIKPSYMLNKVRYHLGVEAMLRLKVLLSISASRRKKHKKYN